MIGSACTWRYHSISSLLQRPMRLMISVYTLEQSSTMAAATQRDRAETSLCVKPRWVPARSLTVALRWAVIIVRLMFVQRPLCVLKRARGVSAGALCCRRWATRRHNASFGKYRGSPVSSCTILSPRTPFFCIVKKSITNTAAASSLSVAVAVSNTMRPTLNVTSESIDGNYRVINLFSPW